MKTLVIDLTGDDNDSDLEPPPSKATPIDLRVRSTVNLDEQQPCSSKGLVATPWFPKENQAHSTSNGESSSTIETQNNLIENNSENNSRKCLVCNLIPEQPVITQCDHLHCYKCFSHNIVAQNLIFPKCCLPNCQVILEDDFIKSKLNLKDYVKFLEAHCRFLRNALIYREYNAYMESSSAPIEIVVPEIDNDPSFQTNFFEFKCPICLERIRANEGIMLKNCSHTFCKACFGETIRHCDDHIVICPHRNDDGSACDCIILECEMKAIVSEEIYEMHMKKRIKLAEATMSNVFHCKAHDCDGFITYDDSVKAFPCIICDKVNCIPCEAIHETKTCEQHKEDLQNDEKNRRELQLTQNAVQEMLETGNAILCAQCGSVIQKIIGCDNVQCSICHLPMCWRTGKPRNPLEKYINDQKVIIDGCHCKEGGVLCHPLCLGCH